VIVLEALKSRDGAIYLGGAALSLLITLLIAISTARACVLQWELREAVQAFSQGSGDASKLLGNLRQRGAGDADTQATVRVLLGAYNYDRALRNPQLLETAGRLFEEALQLQAGRASAAVGLACVQLTRADVKDRDARARDADATISELERNLGAGEGSPDVEYLRGAAFILQGKLDDAIRKLDDPNPSQAPSQEGSAARAWNLGVAELLRGNPRAVESFALGFQQRSFAGYREFSNDDPEAGAPPPGRDADADRLLVLAYRVSLTQRPQDPAELRERCQRVRALMSSYSRGPGGLGQGQVGPYLPHRDLLAPVHNAVGIGWFNAGDFAAAAQQFGYAVKRSDQREPLYLLNEGWSHYQAAQQIEPKDADRKRDRDAHLKEAADAFRAVIKLLGNQQGREGTVRLARCNVGAILLQMGSARDAARELENLCAGDAAELSWRAQLGALYDHAGDKRRALESYRKAVSLGHPDSAQIEERIAVLEGRR